MQRSTLGHAAQLTSIAIWSTGLIVQKLLAETADVGAILFLQMGGACALMWMALAFSRSLPRFSATNGLRMAWGLLAPGLVLMLSLAGAARTDGVSASLIWGALPLVGPVLARLLLREPLHWSFPVGALIGFTGLIVLVTERLKLDNSDLTGNLLVLAGVLCAAVSHSIGKKLAGGTTPWYQTATLQVTGATAATFVLTLTTGMTFPDLGVTTQLVAVAYLVLIMGILNFLAFNLALTRIQAAWVSFYGTLAPAFGTIASVVLLGSEIRSIDVVSILVMISGAAFPHLMRIAGLAPRLNNNRTFPLHFPDFYAIVTASQGRNRRYRKAAIHAATFQNR